MGTFRQGKSLWTPLLKAPIKFKASPRQGGAAEAEEKRSIEGLFKWIVISDAR